MLVDIMSMSPTGKTCCQTRLTIEWRHLDVAGETCDRCADTGTSIRALLPDLAAEGLEVAFTETRLPRDRVDESNLVLVNGTPLHELLPDAKPGESACGSCSDLLEEDTSCLTLEAGEESHEAIPADTLRQAIRRALERPDRAACC